MEKLKKKNKILFIFLGVVICALFLTAIIQTFVLKNKQNSLNKLQSETAQIQEQYNEAKEKHDNIFESDISDTEISIDDLKDEYKDDYTRHEGTDENGNPYGTEGEKVIEVTNP